MFWHHFTVKTTSCYTGVETCGFDGFRVLRKYEVASEFNDCGILKQLLGRKQSTIMIMKQSK